MVFLASPVIVVWTKIYYDVRRCMEQAGPGDGKVMVTSALAPSCSGHHPGGPQEGFHIPENRSITLMIKQE